MPPSRGMPRTTRAHSRPGSRLNRGRRAPDMMPCLRSADGRPDGDECADVELDGANRLHAGRKPVDLAGRNAKPPAQFTGRSGAASTASRYCRKPAEVKNSDPTKNVTASACRPRRPRTQGPCRARRGTSRSRTARRSTSRDLAAPTTWSRAAGLRTSACGASEIPSVRSLSPGA